MNNLTLLLVCQAVTTLGLMVFVPIMPLYIATLEQMDAAGAAHWSSLALAAPAIGTLCFAPYVGKCCDRFGYKRMLLASLVVFTASMLLMALSPGVHGFMLGRLLQGISTIGVVLTAFIGYVSDDTSRGRSLGLQESAIACGALAGPLLGGMMLDYWSLKPLLLTSAVLTGVAGGILWAQLLFRVAHGAGQQQPAQLDACRLFYSDGRIRLCQCLRTLSDGAFPCRRGNGEQDRVPARAGLAGDHAGRSVVGPPERSR